MSRGPCKFRQTELTRALKAARKAGVEIRLEIANDGRLILVPEKASTDKRDIEDNEWDRM